MRLDYELIRKLLLHFEEEEPVDLSPYSEEVIDYHARQLVEAGYLRGNVTETLGGYVDVQVNDLTWAGHEFLANARNDKLWRRATAKIAQQGGSASLEVLKAVLTQLAMNVLGLQNT